MKLIQMLQEIPDAPVSPIDPELQENVTNFAQAAQEWVVQTVDQVWSLGSLWQLIAALVAAAIAFGFARPVAARLEKTYGARESKDIIYNMLVAIERITWPAFTVILLWTAMAAFSANGLAHDGLRIGASLLNAWIIVRLITSNMRDGLISGAATAIAWSIAALYIFRLLDPVAASLDSAAISMGDVRISLLQLITSIILASVALWLGRILGDAVQTQLKSTRSLNPSMAGILGQVAKIGIMIIAVMIALSAVGVNLTALTVFGGALGVGIGFGLQTIFSNFISGIIILFERTIKVGDFIELQSGITGQVKEINIRSTLVTTNDNVDILVPNEEFIKAQVINWTMKEANRRLRVPFGVAYGSDKELVRKAGLEAAAEVPWTEMEDARAPQVWLVGFGDSSLDFELVVWLHEDAVVRPAKVQADYNWALHTALEKYDLEIPFPQRDINFRHSAPVKVQILEGGAEREVASENADGEKEKG